MLRFERKKYHKTQAGQTLLDIARAYHVSERLLAQENALTCPPKMGQILKIPAACGDEYTARSGDDPRLLCGSEEKYRLKNGTDILYIGMRVIL